MRRYLLLIPVLVAILCATGCIKDRVQPAGQGTTTGTPIPAGDTLMYYWSFNGADSSMRQADFGVHGGTFNYYCAYIDYTGGSPINVQGGAADSGQCLRVRNPSDSLIFYMPTTGYDSVTFAFAEEASSTSSGSTLNGISYTTDGVNYVTTALGNSNTYNIGITFALYTFNFSSDPATSNNPKFAIKITPLNNNTGTSGNDRFDNVTLSGVRVP
jgi:hypothetical protein